MRLMTAPEPRSHRSAPWACVIAAALLVASCSSDDKTSQGSSGAAPTTAVGSDAPQSTSAGNADTPTTNAGTDSGESTTTAPVAASETTAPDIMRGPPIMSTVPGSTGETTETTAVTATTDTTLEVTTTSAAPESTTTTPPPVTEPATTAPAGDGCVSCAASYVFPYAFFDVPQLGTEPVRGTGCGADGKLGEVIPDGIWDARRITISASTIGIDVQCVYYGASGAQLLANCLAEEGPDGCEDTDPDFWFVNASSRIRTMPLAPEFRRRYATIDCVDPGPGNTRGVEGQDDFDSWVVIEQGQATFVLTSCVYG